MADQALQHRAARIDAPPPAAKTGGPQQSKFPQPGAGEEHPAQLAGIAVNNDRDLEHEATMMGARAMQLPAEPLGQPRQQAGGKRLASAALVPGLSHAHLRHAENMLNAAPPVQRLRALGRMLAQSAAARGSSGSAAPVQRMILPLGDLADLERREPGATAERRASATVISDAAENSRRATNERVAHPWEERFRPFKRGALAGIGLNEELRIYGHGEVYEGEAVVAQIGGYTPQALATKLIRLGVPATYGGEIYLTGCETAKGDDDGYLGLFYPLISSHCPNVTVKGNLARSTTFADGRQGVWTGNFESEEQLQAAKAAIGNDLISRSQELGLKAEAAEAAIGTPVEDEMIGSVAAQTGDLQQRRIALTAQKDRLHEAAYSTTGEMTVTLPR
jgi:hypothetical protein